MSTAKEIRNEIRSEPRRGMADGAKILSLYLWPKLDSGLTTTSIREALGFVPYIKPPRIEDIVQHVGRAGSSLIGSLSDNEREALAHYLDNIDEYRTKWVPVGRG